MWWSRRPCCPVDIARHVQRVIPIVIVIAVIVSVVEIGLVAVDITMAIIISVHTTLIDRQCMVCSISCIGRHTATAKAKIEGIGILMQEAMDISRRAGDPCMTTCARPEEDGDDGGAVEFEQGDEQEIGGGDCGVGRECMRWWVGGGGCGRDVGRCVRHEDRGDGMVTRAWKRSCSRAKTGKLRKIGQGFGRSEKVKRVIGQTD